MPDPVITCPRCGATDTETHPLLTHDLYDCVTVLRAELAREQRTNGRLLGELQQAAFMGLSQANELTAARAATARLEAENEKLRAQSDAVRSLYKGATTMRTFRLHWLNGKTEDRRGVTIEAAMAGCSRGVLPALDYWEELTDESSAPDSDCSESAQEGGTDCK